MLKKALSISMQAIALRLSESLGRRLHACQMKILHHHPHFLNTSQSERVEYCQQRPVFLVLDCVVVVIVFKVLMVSQ